MDRNYTVFHLHDFTSNCNGYMDSTTDYKKYVKLAKKNNMKSIAFSNHGGIYDWVKKKQLCDKNGIKYIHGFEGYMCTKYEADERGYHIGIYAKNFDGVLEVNQLLSNSFLKGDKEDKSDRHFYHNPRISMLDIMNTSKNVIITSACLQSMIWKKRNDKDKYVENFISWMSNNTDRCFLEIQYHNCEDQIEYNKMLYNISKENNIRLIAGTDTHNGDSYDSECRLILQKSKNMNYGTGDDLEEVFDLNWKNYSELLDMFIQQDSLPKDTILEAIENTNIMADMVESFVLDNSFKYPNLYKEQGLKLWEELIDKKLEHKILNGIIDSSKIDKYKSNIKEEFDAMSKQDMQDFMLFMAELVEYCNNNDIPYGFCRGSVGGSLIAYITDITDVDPIVWNTVFSRFCNSDRISLADIDIDFAPEDRIKVYEYIIKRFTPQQTSYILALGTLKDRGVIDTLARGLDYEDLKLVADIKNNFDRIFEDYKSIVQEEVNIEELVEDKIIESSSIDFDHHKIYESRINIPEKKKQLNKLKEEFDIIKKDNQDLFYYFDGLKKLRCVKIQSSCGYDW